MPATKSSRTNLLTMSYDVVACYVQWFMGQHLGSTAVMPLGEICQLCKRHRPRYRRQCVRCNKLVGPGCDPEQCLYADYGNATGICRDCHRIAQDCNVWADCRKCGGVDGFLNTGQYADISALCYDESTAAEIREPIMKKPALDDFKFVFAYLEKHLATQQFEL